MADNPYAQFLPPNPYAEFVQGAVPKAGQTVPPTMSPMEATGNISKGVVRGVRDPIDAGAQLLTRGLEGVAPEGSWFHRYMQGQRELVEKINREAEEDYQKNWRGGAQGTDIGRIAGNVAAAVPITAAMPGATAEGLAARALSGVASGGTTGALQPVDAVKHDFWGEKASQAGMGMLGGGAAPVASGAVASVIRPNTSRAVQTLLDANVRLTPGQMAGGWANRLEEAYGSVPVLGDAIRASRGKAVESLNRAAIDDALAPIGVRLPANVAMGRDAVRQADDIVGQRYDALLPQLRVRADPQFANNVQTLWHNAQYLEPDQLRTLQTVLQDKVFHRFSPSGGMTGNDFKTIESELGRLAKNYGTSADAGQRELGGALRQMQAEMRDLLERSNPAHADELRNINAAYAGVLRIKNAAGRPGAHAGAEQEMGVFSPAQMGSAVRSLDPSMRKGAYSRGEAQLQELSDAAQTAMGNKVPDSGTPYRSMVGLPMLMAAGHFDPTGMSMMPIMAAGAGAAAYSTPMARNLAEALLAQRPAVAAPIASVVRRNPVTTPLAAILAQQGGNP